MSNANGAGIKNIGDCGPEGSTLGKDSSAKVGFHGLAAVKATGAGTELMGAMNAFLTAMNAKGLYNQSGTLGDDLKVGDGFSSVGVIRADGDLDIIVDADSGGEGIITWRWGGTTTAGSTSVMELDTGQGDLTLVGDIKTTSDTAGFGYGTGAGGSVTQITDRTTGVTLDKNCGTITTDTTSLAAGAAATFTVSNDSIGANSLVQLSIKSGATTNQTRVSVTATANNSFDITVENNHASTAETGAIVMLFAKFNVVTS